MFLFKKRKRNTGIFIIEWNDRFHGKKSRFKKEILTFVGICVDAQQQPWPASHQHSSSEPCLPATSILNEWMGRNDEKGERPSFENQIHDVNYGLPPPKSIFSRMWIIMQKMEEHFCRNISIGQARPMAHRFHSINDCWTAFTHARQKNPKKNLFMSNIGAIGSPMGKEVLSQ